MGQPLTVPPPGFEDLSVEEQIDYVQALWDRIAGRQQSARSPDWHRAEVGAAVAEHEADPDAGRSWADVRADLQDRLRRR